MTASVARAQASPALPTPLVALATALIAAAPAVGVSRSKVTVTAPAAAAKRLFITRSAPLMRVLACAGLTARAVPAGPAAPTSKPPPVNPG